MPTQVTLLGGADTVRDPDYCQSQFQKLNLVNVAKQMLSTLQYFYLAMASYPEVQARANAEPGEVIGPHRLPKAEDKFDLSYLCAVVIEFYSHLNLLRAMDVPLADRRSKSPYVVADSHVTPHSLDQLPRERIRNSTPLHPMPATSL